MTGGFQGHGVLIATCKSMESGLLQESSLEEMESSLMKVPSQQEKERGISINGHVLAKQ